MTDVQTAMLEHLAAIHTYARESASYRRRDDLAAALTDDEQIRAYELTNGKRSAQQVKEDGNISKSGRSILRWWQDWVDRGLAEKLDDGSVRARYDPFVLKAGGSDAG